MRLTINGLFILVFLYCLGCPGSGYLTAAGNKPAKINGHIIADLACQAPPRDATTGKLIDSSNPIYRDSFTPREEVWVALDINLLKKRKDGANLYVVENIDKNLIDENKLRDITGTVEKIKINPIPGISEGLIYIRVWKHPRFHPKGYDVIVDFKPFGTYDKGKDIVDGLTPEGSSNAKGFDVPKLWVCLESISFNHSPNSGYFDAIDIRQNQDKDISPPEWRRNGKSYPATYIKNRSIKIKAVFSAAHDLKSVRVGAFKLSGRLGDVKEAPVTLFTKCHILKNYRSGSKVFQIYLPTPGEITSFYQEWQWYFKYNNNDNVHSIGESINKIFIVLGQPQSPWKTKGKSKPWTELLDLACKWAHGESTPESAAAKITYYLYNHSGGEYERDVDHTYTTNSYKGDFDLTLFLGNIPNVGTVTCSDMGKALVTFSNVIGCGTNYRHSRKFGNHLNCIRPVGAAWCSTERCKFHVFASVGDKIFDATFYYLSRCIDTICDPHSAYVMVNILWENYKRKMVNEGIVSYPETFPFNIAYEN